MTQRPGRDLWGSFQHDPRDPAVGPLRASDADRDVVHGVLAEAFADGRLDREEYDERSAAALEARTLGQLPALITDLVPDRPLLPATVPLTAMSTADLRGRATEKWRKDRREAFIAFVGSALVTWSIWAVVMFGEFPWPVIVNAFALMNFIRVAASRRELVQAEVERLQRKQAKALLRAQTRSQPKGQPRVQPKRQPGR